MGRGKLIVFEGLDRAGKSSQAEKLQKRLEEEGERVVMIKFPDRTTSIGKLIDDYLNHRIQMDDHAIHLLFAANRWEHMPAIRKHLEENTTVILDRYLYSGAVYSVAKQIPGLDLTWATNPDVGLARPDILIFLDLEPAVAAQRAGFGAERYEKAEMQARVKDGFAHILGFTTHNPGPRVADVDLEKTNNVLRVNADGTIEEIHEYIYTQVKRQLDRVDKENIPVQDWKLR